MKEKPKFRLKIIIGNLLPPHFEWQCINPEADDLVETNREARDFWLDYYLLSDYVVQP